MSKLRDDEQYRKQRSLAFYDDIDMNNISARSFRYGALTGTGLTAALFFLGLTWYFA